MHKFLIPFVACLLCTATLYAQVPEVISVPNLFPPNYVPSYDADALCNDAGTFMVGPFVGQSNDTALDTIYLCEGDSIFIDHNGDFDLSGDPDGTTPPGVGYIFYDCAPTVIGDNLQAILANDPCLLLAPNTLPYFAFGNPSGDIWFFNSGNLQTLFNGGQPVLLHFAPVTVDNFGSSQPYESNVVGAPPGPCVNVNTGAAFEVVYLNAIQESSVETSFGDDCIGKFNISGGYPQWDLNAKYTIDISLDGDPSVKALIYNPVNQIGHDANVIFYVTTPGIYNVTVEDGKSCGHTFQIAMNGCDASDNVVISLPDTLSPPGSTICVPVTATGFEIVGASFALSWDPALLQYDGVQNAHPAIGTFNANNVNTLETVEGNLGVIIYDQDNLGNVITIPDGEALFELCFTVIGPLGACSGLTVTNDPSQINLEDENGNTLPLTVDTGQICIDFLPLAMVAEVIDPTCLGTASIKVTATGGTTPYDVLITNIDVQVNYAGQIPTAGGMFVRTGITSGTYSVCVTENNGAGPGTICDTITVLVPTLGASLVNTKRPTCNGDNDGIVTAVVSVDGTTIPNPGPNFTFNWSPAPSPGGPVYNGASSGTYFVTVTDLTTGCTAGASGTLDQPPPMSSPTVTVTPATCTGLFDGAITYIPSGGTPFPNGEYDYNWEYVCPPGTTQTQGPSGRDSAITITGLAACSWSVTITDANGCTLQEEIDVPNQRIVDVVLTTNPLPPTTNCAGDSTASICIQVMETPASPNPSYLFFWSPVGFPQSTPGGPLTSCYNNLPAGTYSVLAVDAIGCADTAMIVVTSPPILELDTFSYQRPGCTVINNGAIEVVAKGGTGSPSTYVYNWTPAATGAKISNLLPGDYSVTVTDLKGCQDSLDFTLTLPDPPAITQVDSVSVKCGNDGCLSVTAPGAATFEWQTIDGIFLADTSQICNLQGDTFVITLMDDQGCTTIDTFSLAPVTPMSISDTTIIEPSCFGYDDGSIGITVIDGTPFPGNPSYNYIWSDSLGQTFPTMTNVTAGDYSVTVTDSKGCTLIDTFTLTEPPQIIVTHAPLNPTVSCFGVCDAAVVLTVGYADGTGTDFNYVWSDMGAGDSTRNNLCADTISVIAIDGNNCFGTDTIEVLGPPEVTFDTLYTIPTSCNGGDDGQAIVEGAGGNGGPYTYQWNDPLSQNTATATNLTADEWAVTITDVDGCTGVYIAEVTEPEAIVVIQDDATSKPILCFGGNEGELGVTVTGGNVGTFTFSWVNQDSMSMGTGQTITNLSAGVYSVTATDTKGCTGVLLNLLLDEPPPVVGSYLPWEALLCFGDETTLYIDTIYGGSGGPYKFSLDFGVTLDPGFPVSLSGGEHYITYLDRFDCEFTDTIDVIEPNQIVVTFDPAIKEIELGDTTYQLNPIVTGAVVDTFIWFPGETLHFPNDFTPLVHTFENQTYTITVFDANGCEGTGSIDITVDPNRNVYVPNVFFPGNPGGLNDHFNPQIGLGVELVNYMRIYDRWGALMYSREKFYPENDNFAEGWDGRHKGDYVNPGVFVYVIEVKFLDNKVLLYRGDVTVVR